MYRWRQANRTGCTRGMHEGSSCCPPPSFPSFAQNFGAEAVVMAHLTKPSALILVLDPVCSGLQALFIHLDCLTLEMWGHPSHGKGRGGLRHKGLVRAAQCAAEASVREDLFVLYRRHLVAGAVVGSAVLPVRLKLSTRLPQMWHFLWPLYAGEKMWRSWGR